jgi:hypothetical protein
MLLKYSLVLIAAVTVLMWANVSADQEKEEPEVNRIELTDDHTVLLVYTEDNKPPVQILSTTESVDVLLRLSIGCELGVVLWGYPTMTINSICESNTRI